MKISLIICTYMRPKPLIHLLDSVEKQTVYPDQILIVDGSLNNESQIMLEKKNFRNIHYFLVDENERGLTKQRNFGINKVADDIAIVAFLDDDTALMPDYFEQLINTFQGDHTITGVGGIAINENTWTIIDPAKKYSKYKHYMFEGFVTNEGQRNVLRNFLKLHSNLDPGRMPDYSHGKTCGFPLTGKQYEVDLLIGMSFAFRKRVFQKLRFSVYFEGYGLYEDADFSIRAQKLGKNVINTKVQLYHFHNPSGRPNSFKYGKMVLRNGWYVWRLKYPNPSLTARLKWNLIHLVLLSIRFSNTFTSSDKKDAFLESVGRTAGWLSLLVNKPKIIDENS